jgi:hypothetical protein
MLPSVDNSVVKRVANSIIDYLEKSSSTSEVFSNKVTGPYN